MRPRTALATFMVAGGAAVGAWTGVSVAGWVAARWVDASLLERGALEPWSPGMSLRQTFDTFPAPAGPPPRLRVLDDNPTSWVERWRLLGWAHDRIDAATFIVRDDVFGMAFLGHLLERARAGVRVRLLVDAHGTKMARSVFEEDYLDELAGAGIEVRIYRPMPSRIAQAVVWLDPVAAIASEHDKLLLVDRRLSLVGGRNVGAEYFADPRTAPDAFRDVDLVVEGGGPCRAFERAFDAEWVAEASGPVAPETVNLASKADVLLGAYRAMDAWLRGHPERVAGDVACAPWLEVLRVEQPGLCGALADARPDDVGAPVRLLDSAPRRTRGDDPVTEGLRRLLGSAQREVLVVSPYLVLSDAAVRVLEQAAARGVRLTVLTNSPTSSDNAVSQAFFMEQWPELLARVPTLRLFVRGDGHNLHAKAAVVDDQVAVVSTYNLDPVSMYVDGEVAIVAWSPLLAARLAAPVRTWIATGAPDTLEYRIARDARGAARRDADGRPIVVFGPRDHTDPDRWTGLRAWWALLRTLEDWTGFDPIF